MARGYAAFRPGGAFHIVECGTAQLSLDAFSRDEIQAVATTFGIPGEIDLTDWQGPGTGKEFPYVAQCLADLPFRDVMLACAADGPAQVRDWSSEGDDRIGMGWRKGIIAETARSLRRPRGTNNGVTWGHEIVAADLRTMPAS